MSIFLQATTTVLDTANAAMQTAPAVVKELSVLELLTKGGIMMIPLVLSLAIAINFKRLF